MADTIAMNAYTVNGDTGAVEVSFTWRGQQFGATFDSVARMIEVAADPIQSPADAVRVLLAY